MDGWFCVSRKLLSHKLWLSEPFTRGQAWVDLCGLANHANGLIVVRGIKVHVLRGQVGWSQARLAERWHWSRARVAHFLDELEIEQQIKQQNGGVTTLITILNYDTYQRALQQTLQQNDERSSKKAAERCSKISQCLQGSDPVFDGATEQQKIGKTDTNNKEQEEVPLPLPPAREAAPEWPSIDDWMFAANAKGMAPTIAIEEWHFQEKLNPPWKNIGDWRKHLNHICVKWEQAGRPTNWKNNYATNRPTRRQVADRSAGTANDGKASQYKLRKDGDGQ